MTVSGWTMLISSSGSVFLCSVMLSTVCLSGSESTGAVLKLSGVHVVSGVLHSGSVVGSHHNSSQLNRSKLDNTGVLPPGSSTVLLARGPRSSSSSGDSGDGFNISKEPSSSGRHLVSGLSRFVREAICSVASLLLRLRRTLTSSKQSSVQSSSI